MSNAVAAYAKDESVRLQFSGGGIFTVLAERVLDDGGVVVGVAQTAPYRRHHPGQIHPRPADKDVLPVSVIIETGVYPCAGDAWADQVEGCGVGKDKRTAVRRSFRWFEVAWLFASWLSLRKGATSYAFRSFAGSAISKCLRSFGRNFRRCYLLCHFIAPGSYGSGVPYSKAKPAVQV